MAVSRWQAPETQAAGPLDVLGWFDGPPVPDPVTFVIGEDWLGKPNLYPRQATLIKIIFLRDDLFTDYDRQVIAGWQQRFAETNPDAGDGKFAAQTKGLQPDLFERIAYLKKRGYKWFPELIIAIGRRGSKGYLSALCMAYVLWNYLAKGNPQDYYGIDENKPLACAIFAGKKEQAKENLWGDLYSVITGAPCFTEYISEALAESLTVYAPFDFVRMRKLAQRGITSSKDMATFRIVPRESTPLAPRGPAGCILGFDEAAHVKNAGVTREFGVVYNAAKPSLDQFGTDGFVVLPSSTWEMIGKFYELWELSLAREPGGEPGEYVPAYPTKFMIQIESWAIYEDWERAHLLPLFPPGFTGDLGEYDPQDLPLLRALKGAIQGYDEEMAREEKANPDTFGVERRSNWATALDAYLNTAKINEMFEPWAERDPKYGRPELTMQGRGPLYLDYTAHGDPASVNCRFGFCLAHAEPGPDGLNHAVIDLVHFWDPADSPGHILDYDVIMQWIYDNVALRFQPDEVTFDQWNSMASVPALQKLVRGGRLQKNVMVYERTATAALNWSTYETFKAALNMGFVHCPPHGELKDELRFIQKPEGQQKVLPPDSGPVQTKDIADCYTHRVEVLTEHGWKHFKDVLDGERVATRNEHGELEYQHFTQRIERHHKGAVYQFEGERLNFSVTPRHRMLVQTASNQEWRFINAEDLKPGQRYTVPKTTVITGREPGITDLDGGRLPVPTTGPNPGKSKDGRWSAEEDAWLTENYPSMPMDELLQGLPGRSRGGVYQRAKKFLGLERGQIGDRHGDKPKPLPLASRELFAAFLGLWLADGRKYHHGSQRGYGVVISVKKQRKIDFLEDLLSRMGWPYACTTTAKGESRFEVKSYGLREYLRALCTGEHELHIPDEVFTGWTAEEMQALLSGLSVGDGSYSSSEDRFTRYCTSSRRLADDVQRLLLHIGMTGSVRQSGAAGDQTNFPGHVAKHDQWYVGYDLKGGGTAGVRGSQIEQVEYDGPVYCLTVPNGTLMVRREGVAMWAGNCAAIVTARLLGEQMKAYLAKDLRNQRPHMGNQGGRDPFDRFSPDAGNPLAGELGSAYGRGGLSRGFRPGTAPRAGRAQQSRYGNGAGAMRRHRS